MKRLFSLILALGISLSLSPPAVALELESAKELLETYYVDKLPEGYENMASLEELFSAIEDPYTGYLTAEEYEQLLTSVNGDRVVGVGISIQNTFHDGYQILSVLPDSPAQNAGLKVGDFIVSVDRTPLTSDTDPASLIQGREGTSVSLTIRDPDTGHFYNKTLIRCEVLLPIVTYGMEGSALALYCDSFGESTPELVKAALTEYEQSASACIMDLRNNPGGTSASAAGTAGLFLGGPSVICHFRDAADEYTTIYTNPSCPDLTDKPLIILTNSNSASASELFAAAIRDYNAGIAIGQRTYGKGIAQFVLDQSTHPEIFKDDALKITVYRFFSPYGATNDTIGVIPTLVLSEENTPIAARLLSCHGSPYPENHLKLELAGQTFYINLYEAMEDNNKSAFTELLEALPASAQLRWSTGDPWEDCAPITPTELAEEFALSYVPRTFSDIAGTDYEWQIRTLACYQLLSGYGDNTFRPNHSISRAEFCAMVAAALALPTSSASNHFTDIPEDAWYSSAVNTMASRGFISGYEDQTFRPDATITYEEIVAILANISVWACMDGFDYAQLPQNQFTLETYEDYSDWALPGARILDLFGALLRNIDPSSPGTRGAAAATLCKLLDSADLLWN